MLSRFSILALLALIAALFYQDGAPWQGSGAPAPADGVVVTHGQTATPDAPDLTGPVRVVDGDTIRLGEHRIRLHGIDAPESDQACLDAQGASWACGDAATERLAAMIGSDPVQCLERDIDRYQRIVGECFSGGSNLNAALVAEGFAFAYRRYSMDYAALEDEARDAGHGIWTGAVQAPWEHRREPRYILTPHVAATGSTPLEPETRSEPHTPGACLIKGNINRRGERIYHMPDSPSYSRTRIDESRGQRWFCTEEEARAAGWRAPRG